jgi:hypothetical protein
MKQILSLSFVFAAYFAQAQTSFHKHEVVAGVIPFPYYWGYRYHWSPQWAARATYSFRSSNDGSPTWSATDSLTLLKIGAQWAFIPAAPVRPIFFADIVVPYGVRSGGHSLPPQSGGSYGYNERFVGLGIGLGAGLDAVIAKRVSLSATIQPILALNWNKGSKNRDGIETAATPQSGALYYDAAITIGYRFL